MSLRYCMRTKGDNMNVLFGCLKIYEIETLNCGTSLGLPGALIHKENIFYASGGGKRIANSKALYKFT